MNNEVVDHRSNSKERTSFEESDDCKNISSLQKDYDIVESKLKRHNDALEGLTSFFQRDPDFNKAFSEFPKEQEMEVLLSEINALKSKLARRRSDENKRTSEEIVHLYEENYKLSATIEALNRSSDKRRIQCVSLKEENEKHKYEKKKLHTLLKSQVSQKDYLRGNSTSHKIAIVEKITNLEKQNIELLSRYQDVLNVLKMERKNYTQFLKFIFLKILIFKCLAFSRNQIFNNDSLKLKNSKRDKLPIDPKNCFLVRICKHPLNEGNLMNIPERKKCISSGNANSEMEEKYLLSQERESLFRDTRDASTVCKLGNKGKRVSSGVDFEPNLNKFLQSQFYKRNRKVNSTLQADSSGDYNHSSNLQKIIVLIRLYKEKFHDKIKEKVDSKVKSHSSLELKKVNKNFETNSYLLVSKSRYKTGIPLRKKNRVCSSKSHIIRIVEHNTEPGKNKIQKKIGLSKIENSEFDKELKSEVAVENSIMNLNQRKKDIQEMNYFEFYTLANDIFWNNTIFMIQFDEVLSIKIQDPLIVNNLVNINYLEFISKKTKFSEDTVQALNFAPVFEKIEPVEPASNLALLHTVKENFGKLGEFLFNKKNEYMENLMVPFREGMNIEKVDPKIVEEDSKYEEENPKVGEENHFKNKEKDPKIDEDPKIEEKDIKINAQDLKIEREDSIVKRPVSEIKETNSKIETIIVPDKSMNNSLSPCPIVFSPAFKRSRKASRKSKISVSIIKNVNPEVEELDFKIEEHNSKFENNVVPKKPEALTQDVKMGKQIEKQSNTILRQKRISRSLLTERTRFLSTSQKLRKTGRKSIERESKIEEPRSKIQEQDIKIKKVKAKMKEQDLKIEKQDLKIEKQTLKVEEDDPKLKEQDNKIEKQNFKIEEQTLKVEEHDLKTEEENLKVDEQENLEVEEQDPSNEKLNLVIKKQDFKIEDQKLYIEEQVLKIEEKNFKVEENVLKFKGKDVIIEEPDIKIEEKNFKVEENVLKFKGKDVIIEEPDIKIEDEKLKIHVLSKIPKDSKQDIKIEKEIEKQLSTTLELKRVSGSISVDQTPISSTIQKPKTPSEKNEKQYPKTKIIVISKKSEDSIQEMKNEKEKKKHLSKTLEIKRINGSISIDETSFLSISQKVKSSSEKAKQQHPETKIVVISKTSEDSIKEIKVQEQKVQKELKISLEPKKIGKPLSGGQSQVSSIQKSSREQNLNQKTIINQKTLSNQKTALNQKNAVNKKKNPQIKATDSSAKVIKKDKIKVSQRSQTSEAKLHKIKTARKVQSLTKCLNKKGSNSWFKKSVSKIAFGNFSVFSSLEFKTKPESRKKSKMKKVDLSKAEEKIGTQEEKKLKKLKSKIKAGPTLVSVGVGEGSASSEVQIPNILRKLMDESTETNPRVDVCVFTEESFVKESVYENRKMISNRSFQWINEGVKLSSESISIESTGSDQTSRVSSKKIESESKKPDIASWISPQHISRSRKSDEGKENNQFRNRERSKESKKEVNRVRDCDGESNRESSLKGEEFIQGIEPSRSESNKRTSNCEAVWEDFGSRKCSQMSQDSDWDKAILRRSTVTSQMQNMGAIEDTESILTSLTRNDTDVPVIMIGGTSEILREKEIHIDEGNRIWTDEISKIEAWNIRVRNYLKEVRMKLLEEEIALEKERLHLRHRNYSPGNRKELTPRNMVDVRYLKTDNNVDYSLKMDSQMIFRDVERVKNIINNHTATRYLNRRSFSRVDEKLKKETGSVTKLFCRSLGRVTAMLNDMGYL